MRNVAAVLRLSEHLDREIRVFTDVKMSNETQNTPDLQYFL